MNTTSCENRCTVGRENLRTSVHLTRVQLKTCVFQMQNENSIFDEILSLRIMGRKMNLHILLNG